MCFYLQGDLSVDTPCRFHAFVLIFSSWEVIQCTYAHVFVSFQFKTLICMCEMCCSGVKCSAVPSWRKTTTHPLLLGRVGRLGWEGGGRRIGEQKKKVMKEGERVTDAPVHLTENRHPHCAWQHKQQYECFPRSLSSISLHSSLFSFFLFLLLFFVLLSVRNR